jgi:hypothetical protein
MQSASSLFLTAGQRLSNVARVFDNFSALRKQIIECFSTSDNIGPAWKQIVACSSAIRQFRSTVLSGFCAACTDLISYRKAITTWNIIVINSPT